VLEVSLEGGVGFYADEFGLSGGFVILVKEGLRCPPSFILIGRLRMAGGQLFEIGLLLNYNPIIHYLNQIFLGSMEKCVEGVKIGEKMGMEVNLIEMCNDKAMTLHYCNMRINHHEK
jgi:hypothetical protein